MCNSLIGGIHTVYTVCKCRVHCVFTVVEFGLEIRRIILLSLDTEYYYQYPPFVKSSLDPCITIILLLYSTQRGAEEPAHYGKLDHAGKKTATVAPAVGDAEYGKLDRVSHTSINTQQVVDTHHSTT